MAVTKSTDLTYSAVTRYEKNYYLISATRKETFGQFVDWQTPIPDEAGFGGTLNWPTYGELDPVESALTEDADVTPTSIADYYVAISPTEYGRAVGKTRLASFKSRTSLQEVIGKMVANDRINSIDRIIRRSVCGWGNSLPTQRYHSDGSTAMSSLTAADVPTWDWLMEMVARAKATGLEPFEDGNYMCIAHPLLMYEIRKFNEWRVTGMFQSPDMLYSYKAGEMAGINFIESHQGRIHMGAGTAVQAATTTSSAVAAGATTVPATEQTGLVAGDYVVLGTIETESLTAAQMAAAGNRETVLITAAAGSSGAGNLTVRGVGNKPGNFGCRFDHAAAESIVEAPAVASIPLIGKNSIIGVHGSSTGRYGIPKMVDGTLDILGRIAYFGWYWYGGCAINDNMCILGRCAVSKSVVGYN